MKSSFIKLRLSSLKSLDFYKDTICFEKPLEIYLRDKLLRKRRIVNGIVKIGTKKHIQFILKFFFFLFIELYQFFDFKRFGSDQMRKQILIPNKIIDFITDYTALWWTNIFMRCKVGSKVEIERTINITILYLSGLRLRSGISERTIIKIVTNYVNDFFVDDFGSHNVLNYN